MLESDQLIYLDDKSKDRYTRMEQLFDQDGWRLFIEWATMNQSLAQQRALVSPTWDTHLIARTQAIAYEQLTKFEDSVYTEYAALAEQAKEQLDETVEALDIAAE